MDNPEIKRGTAHLALALNGKLEPEIPKEEAFAILENILGDLMSLSTTNASLLLVLYPHIELPDAEKVKAVALMGKQAQTINSLVGILRTFLEKAKEAGRGRD